MRWSNVIQFDRIEKDRMYLGFKQTEIDFILEMLEKHAPDDEITSRIDVLNMAFRKKLRKEE